MPLYRSGGQAQYVDEPIAPDPGGLFSLLEWGRANLDKGISVDDLVRRAALSPRTLTRRFRGAVGMPPGEWLQRERLRLAQRLLEQTDGCVVHSDDGWVGKPKGTTKAEWEAWQSSRKDTHVSDAAASELYIDYWIP